MEKFIVKNTRSTPPTDDSIIVYTDGSCLNNGRKNAKAGLGVYFGTDDPRNVSERITGLQTNNRAELLAILKALTILKEEMEGGRKIIIYTDSKYSVLCCTTYGERMAKQGWTNKGKCIPNVEIVKNAYNLFKRYNNLSLAHVMAHTGLQDAHSTGNENADRLANAAVGVKSCPNAMIFLNVPFEEKDDAKRLGAKWNRKKKKWVISSTHKNKKQMMERWGDLKK